MTHNWKPGDIALVEAGCWANRVVALRSGVPSNMGWAYCGEQHEKSSNKWSSDASGIVTPIRPLLVIDPEDRAQIMRLAEAWDAQTDVALEDGEPMSLSGWHMQAALRSLLESEPEEPTTWLAVVRDGAGEEWYRWDECGDKRSWGHRRGERADSAWSDLPRPLTVLSPGYVEEGE